MACNCKNRSSQCGFSGGDCPNGVISATCVIYYGNRNLDQIDSSYGDRLEQILINVNERLRVLSEQVTNGFIGQNVGGGVEIYIGLDEDGVGRLRTLRSTESIIVSNDAETIAFSVRQSWLDSQLQDIRDSVTDYGDRIEALETRVSEVESRTLVLETTVSQHSEDINMLYSRYNNLQEDVTNLHEEVNSLHTHVTNNTTRITALEERMNNLEQLINNIGALIEGVGISVNEEFFGRSIMTLSHDVVSSASILGVYYNGTKLRNAYWTFSAPNQVSVNLNAAELTVEANDCIHVQYQYIPDTSQG